MLLKKTVGEVGFTTEEIGEAIARASDQDQREILIAMCNATDMMDIQGGSWAFQCRAIVDGVCGPNSGLSDSDRSRIASMLNCLVDHLLDPVR